MPRRTFFGTLHTALSNLFMSNPPPMDQFLFPQDDFTCAVSYSRRFLTNKDDRLLAKSCKIERVSHFKDVNRVYHELVLIEVVFSSNSNKIKTFIQSERWGGEVPHREGSTPSPSSSSSSISSLSSNGVKAKDIIFIPGTETREKQSFDKRTDILLADHHRLRTISLSKPCSVAQLLIMLTVLHDCSPNYTVLEKQCYWYAGTQCEMLREEFGGIVSNDAEGGRAGTYGSFQVTKCPVKPEELVKYREAWKAFCDQDDREQRVSTFE
jgi:hypothetical protein